MNNDPNEPLLLDHEADGIRELDNQLPRWWVWLFYITIFYSAAYLLYYHVFRAGDLQAAEYNREIKAGETVKAAAMTRFEADIPNLKPATEAAALESGRQTYAKYCAACHRADGGGLVGPNLCDNYWMHGSNYTDSVKVIWNGVPAKGMIAWNTTLKPDEIQAVAGFLYTLRGTQPTNPKPPENQAAAPAAPSPSQFE
jgi:cytochrome c oxidase cbb3-type subunit III